MNLDLNLEMEMGITTDGSMDMIAIDMSLGMDIDMVT